MILNHGSMMTMWGCFTPAVVGGAFTLLLILV